MSAQTINVQIPIDLIIDQVSKDIQDKLGKKLLAGNIEKEESKKEIWLTRIETARRLKVSLPTLRKYSLQGIIKVYYLGSNPRYKLSDVENTLKELPVLKFKHNI
ncbi:MAG: hypothetical protein RBT49_05630 [Bacteroidales bacterium]|jgi:hypothetical protein|nr:hypothetical protein [Bacteroidales bacterium]